jgi:uncharacterized membrane protein YuzA (DUF378 family)
MSPKIGGETGDVLAQLVTIVAAINWALVEFLNTNLLSDTLGLAEGTLTLVYALIGVAAVVALYNLAYWQGWISRGE